MDGGDPGGSLIIKLLILLALILVNAFFAMSEIAIISLNDNKIRKMAEENHKKAKQVLRLTKNSSRFLSTIQVGVTLSGFLTSASAATSMSAPLSSWLYGITGLNKNVIHAAAVIVITVIISYFSLVLGELVPKRIAMQSPERISFAVIGVLSFTAALASPLVKFLSLSTNALLRALRIDPNAESGNITEEEIRMLVDVGEEKGVIEESQKEMINNIFEFDDITAGDIMTHRTDIVALSADEPLPELVRTTVADGYSRIPVYEDELDNIIGIVYVKDFLPYILDDLPEGKTLRDLMRKPYYVPQTKRCGELFKEMTERKTQMAIVVDEYGGTAGLVTLEDLIESILGNIQDEYDDEDEEISKIDDSTFTVDGVTDIEEVSEIIDAHLPEGDYDTLGGFLISVLGYLPDGAEPVPVKFENIMFTILNVEERRIGKVRVEILPAEEATGKEEGESGKE